MDDSTGDAVKQLTVDALQHGFGQVLDLAFVHRLCLADLVKQFASVQSLRDHAKPVSKHPEFVDLKKRRKLNTSFGVP